MISRYLRDVQDSRMRLAPVMSDLRSRRSRMAGSVNTGSYWRDRGSGARPTALHRSGAICDYADRGRRRRFAAVTTPSFAHLLPFEVARLAGNTDQPSWMARAHEQPGGALSTQPRRPA